MAASSATIRLRRFLVKKISTHAAVCRLRLLEYLELTKPELTTLSVLTTLCGFYLATRGPFDGWLFGWTAIGTWLVGSGAGALNQYLERTYDAMMQRTVNRPLPSGRLVPRDALWFGVVIALVGLLILLINVNVLTGTIAGLILAMYLLVYTPMKRITPQNTFIGAMAGALPPVMGWTAVRNEITVEAGILFAILFLWQMPHFYSLAWLYRKDYERAGFKMLAVVDADGSRTRRQLLVFCGMFIPVCASLTLFGVTGYHYLIGSSLLSLPLVLWSLFLVRKVNERASLGRMKIFRLPRHMFVFSVVHLPILLVLMVFDKA